MMRSVDPTTVSIGDKRHRDIDPGQGSRRRQRPPRYWNERAGTPRCRSRWLIGIKARHAASWHHHDMWHDIATAPLDQDVELAVIDREVLPLPFPCVHVADGWINVWNGKRIRVQPTHWRRLPRTPFIGCGCC